VLITGGSSGIGKATAALLADSPLEFAVVICGRDVERLESAITEIGPNGNYFQAVQADVTQPADVERLIDSALSKFGRIDALVNSAGAGYLGTFSETTEETMDRLWNVNVKGAMRVTQAVLPGMVERKNGRIVNLCGVLGVKTIANAALYCATKHALVGFGGALAQELKRSNVSVTSLCCSGVDSPFWEGVPGKPRAEMLLKPEEVASEIVHLLRQPAHTISNQVLLQHIAHQL
jgi:short-subunit dehydrogenase